MRDPWLDVVEQPCLGVFLFWPNGAVNRQVHIEETDAQSNVVTFDPNAHRPHTRGPARCIRPACRVRWEAVILWERRSHYMECPECHEWTGMFYAGYNPTKDQETFVCTCGGDLYFVIRPGLLLCANCGDEKPFPDIG